MIKKKHKYLFIFFVFLLGLNAYCQLYLRDKSYDLVKLKPEKRITIVTKSKESYRGYLTFYTDSTLYFEAEGKVKGETGKTVKIPFSEVNIILMSKSVHPKAARVFGAVFAIMSLGLITTGIVNQNLDFVGTGFGTLIISGAIANRGSEKIYYVNNTWFFYEKGKKDF